MIRFDAENHRYYDGAREVPGVSHILTSTGNGGYFKSGEWYKTKGTFAHKATALYDLGTLDESTVNDTIRPYLDAWKAFVKDTKAKMIHVERLVYSDEHDYAGTLDRVCFLPDVSAKPMVLDIKSGSRGKAHHLQLGAYVLANDKNWEGQHSAVLYLKETGKYSLDLLDPLQTGSAVYEWGTVLVKYREQEAAISWM